MVRAGKKLIRSSGKRKLTDCYTIGTVFGVGNGVKKSKTQPISPWTLRKQTAAFKYSRCRESVGRCRGGTRNNVQCGEGDKVGPLVSLTRRARMVSVGITFAVGPKFYWYQIVPANLAHGVGLAFLICILLSLTGHWYPGGEQSPSLHGKGESGYLYKASCPRCYKKLKLALLLA